MRVPADAAETRVLRPLHQASANAREIARLLVELLEGWPESRDLLRNIREAEHEGDRLTHEVIDLLNRTFVTPFERDDMYRLATVIDDICDHVDEAADNIDAYEVRRRAGTARSNRRRSSTAPPAHLHEAVELLEGFGDPRQPPLRAARARGRGRPPRRARRSPTCSAPARTRSTIIRWKDIHEQIEEAVDACENAADVLEAIFVKNR